MKNPLSFIFRRKSSHVSFEYQEKKYSFGVIVLVGILTIVIMSLGQRALYDLRDGIPRIPYPHEELQALPEVRAEDEFQFGTLSQLRNRKIQLERGISLKRDEYDSSLLENIAGERDRLYGEEGEIRTQYRENTQELKEVNSRLAKAEIEYERLRDAAKDARKPILDKYRWNVKIRQAKVFAWEALFWIPFFALSLFWYVRSRRKEGRWEIVSLATFIAASILAVQSLSIFLWSWIPHEVLEWLWEILRATLLTRVVGYYLIIALVIFLFGGLIVFVHRRMTDPVRGGRKKIRHGGCPTCSYPLKLSEVYCGGCGKQLKGACGACKKTGYTWGSACIHCGSTGKPADQ